MVSKHKSSRKVLGLARYVGVRSVGHLSVLCAAEMKDVRGETQILWEDEGVLHGVGRTQVEGEGRNRGTTVGMQGNRVRVLGFF